MTKQARTASPTEEAKMTIESGLRILNIYKSKKP